MRTDPRREAVPTQVGMALRAVPFVDWKRPLDDGGFQKTSGTARKAIPTWFTTSASRLFRGCLALFSAALISTASAAPPAPSPSPAARNNAGIPAYDSFRLIHTRNVFDPDRRPVRPPGATAPTTTTRADYVALTGIAVDGDQSLAFFSGSRPEFNLVIPANSKVAGATVTRVNPMNIEVERNGRKLVVNVGQTVPLDDKSNPAAAPSDQPAAAVTGTGPAVNATTATTVTGTAASPAAGSAPGAPAVPANVEEIRRRMMERHNQDQK